MFGEQMDHTQTLTKDLQSFQAKYDNLLSRHEALLVDHEKLSYAFLQRMQHLEKLKVFDDYLQRENYSLLAQHIIFTKKEFIPPCLICIKH